MAVKTLAALLEDPGSIPSSHMVTQTSINPVPVDPISVNPVPGVPMPSSGFQDNKHASNAGKVSIYIK